ncbi:MAG: hypothetical protein JXB88_26130 [Spirochaetales bacterium]|nr:hypothetical protein [Spirochaetales bacterium]
MNKDDFLENYQPVSKKAIIEEQEKRIKYLEYYNDKLEKTLQEIRDTETVAKTATRTVNDLKQKLKRVEGKYNKLLKLAWDYRNVLEFYADEKKYYKKVKIDGRWWYAILEDKGIQAKTVLSYKIVEKPLTY